MKHAISRDGTPIGFEHSGHGAPFLLVHGTTADRNRWRAILPSFERHFTVYLMDRRGRGSSGDGPDYHILREAEDVVAVIEEIGEQVNLLGHSYGGLVSLEAAPLTDKIRRLILYEPPLPADAPFYPPGLPERLHALLDKGENEAALEAMMREVVKMPEHELEVYRRLPSWKTRITLAPTIPREMTVEMNYHFDSAKFAGLRVPTLLLLGGNSPADFRQGLERIDAVLPDSRIISLPGQGHVAMDTNPELFVDRVLSFLQE